MQSVQGDLVSSHSQGVDPVSGVSLASPGPKVAAAEEVKSIYDIEGKAPMSGLIALPPSVKACVPLRSEGS